MSDRMLESFAPTFSLLLKKRFKKCKIYVPPSLKELPDTNNSDVKHEDNYDVARSKT